MNAERMAQRLVAWLRERVAVARAKGVVLGMSGGIDSAVVGALCARAFGPDMLGLIMPCHSAAQDVADAHEVAATCGIPVRIVVLDGVFDVLVASLDGRAGDSNLPVENLKPRLRMVTLYFYANRLNYLVAGTGNRSEIAVGYFTKYGDGGVDLLPLGNLVKAQVREVASHLGVPRRIIEKSPSAGLWPGQTDEGEMGLSYAELDRYLLTGEAIDAVRQRIERMRARSEHKRRMPQVPDF